jgi:hypothetical protein
MIQELQKNEAPVEGIVAYSQRALARWKGEPHALKVFKSLSGVHSSDCVQDIASQFSR